MKKNNYANPQRRRPSAAKLRFIGIIALTAIVVLMTACSNPAGSGTTPTDIDTDVIAVDFRGTVSGRSW